MNEEFGIRNSEFGFLALAPAAFHLRSCCTTELKEIQNSRTGQQR